MSLRGAVVREDADPKKELPVADVEVIAVANGSVLGDGKSDSSGFFTVTLRTRLWIGRAVTLKFKHADYQPLEMNEFIGDKLYVAHLVPVPHEAHAQQIVPPSPCPMSRPAIRLSPQPRPTWAAQ